MGLLVVHTSEFNYVSNLSLNILGPSSFNILQGHSRATMLLIFNNAAQGILSSFFFKYAGEHFFLDHSYFLVRAKYVGGCVVLLCALFVFYLRICLCEDDIMELLLESTFISDEDSSIYVLVPYFSINFWITYGLWRA